MHCSAQARRTLSGLLRKGKEALRESDPSEAILAAKQVRVVHCFHMSIWWSVFTVISIVSLLQLSPTTSQHAGTC